MRFKDHTCAVNPPVQTVDEVFAKSRDMPLSGQEDKLATNLIRRKLAQEGSEDGLLHFRTGGQVLIHTE